MLDPLSFMAISTLIVKSAPLWWPPIRDAFLDKARDKGMDLLFDPAIDKGKKSMRSLFHLDEKEQARHLELALKNALERGLVAFHTPEEQRQYRIIISILCQPGSHGEILRREAMRIFALDETPNSTKLNEVYNRSLPQSTSSPLLDAAPYLSSFFDALQAELYADPLFRPQLSDAIRVRAAMSMQRSLAEVVTTLRQINEALADHYTPEQFEQDVHAYTEHMERTLRYLKLVGIVPKDLGKENRDPELDGIFVPLRIESKDAFAPPSDASVTVPTSIIDFLNHSPCLVLLGGPGSGKSTAVRHLAWSHAIANQSASTTLSDELLLPGKPLPLRIELRRLNEDRKHRPDYNFLTYASKVLLGRAGLDIPPQMFEILLEHRTMLILLDGLDEVASLNDRRTLVEEIEAFAQRYPGNRFLVTSRPVGYELAPLSEQIFSYAKVQPFNDAQIHTFLENWYTYVLRLSPPSPDDQQELEELYTTLEGNPRLHDLAENPLLLTVITALHRYERLPDRRILVYDRCADLLLETWAKLRGTKARWQDLNLEKDDQYACVAYLGSILHKRAQEASANDTTSTNSIAIDVPTHFMQREVEHFLNSQNLFPSKAEQNKQAKRFLELIQEEAGLIVERGSDENGESLYGFVHRTFQEYFAAAHVYKSYQQEEDLTIISDFLREYLHDPHWREVISLLLGKLGRKPTTVRLRQILEGKIKSYRSHYTEIVQQDLFFVSSCLVEEIPVENDLVVLVISQLSEVAKSSPFPSQRDEALKTLSTLTQTRQHATLAQQALKTLVAHYQIVDLLTQIDIAFTLLQHSASAPQVIQEIRQWLLSLAQCPDLPVKPFIEAASNLYLSSSEGSDDERLATQLLLDLAQRSDLAVELSIEAASNLYQSSPEGSDAQQLATQLLLDLAQRSDLAVELSIEAASNLYQSSPSGSDDERLAIQLLLDLAQRSDLAVEQFIQAASNLYRYSSEGSDAQQLATQLLLDLAQRSDLAVELSIEAASNLYQSSPEGSDAQQLATQLLLDLAQRSDLAVELSIEAASNLYRYSSEGSDAQQLATQLLLDLAQRSDLAVELSIEAASNLYQSSSEGSDDERLAIQLLLDLAQRSDLAVELSIEAASNLYQSSPEGSNAQQLAIQLLLDLAQRSDLAVELSIEAASNLYQSSSEGSDDERLATQLLLDLAQRSDLAVEQFIQAAQTVYMHWNPNSEEKLQSFQTLLTLAQQSDIPIEQPIQAIQALYQAIPPKPEERLHTFQKFYHLAQKQNISTEQQLHVATIPLTTANGKVSFQESAFAVQWILTLLQGEAAKQYLKEHWQISYYEIAEPSSIPFAVELARQELLPTEARDKIYTTLCKTVPQFAKLQEASE